MNVFHQIWEVFMLLDQIPFPTLSFLPHLHYASVSMFVFVVQTLMIGLFIYLLGCVGRLYFTQAFPSGHAGFPPVAQPPVALHRLRCMGHGLSMWDLLLLRPG